MNTQTNFLPYTRCTLFITSSHEMAAALGKQHSTIVRHIKRLIADDPGWACEYVERGDDPRDPWYAMSYDAVEQMAFAFRRKEERERVLFYLADLAKRTEVVGTEERRLLWQAH